MDFKNVEDVAGYLTDSFDVGHLFWYDGPLLTLCNNPKIDDDLVTLHAYHAQHRGPEEYHYLVKLLTIQDFARYWLGMITCNELEDHVIATYTSNIQNLNNNPISQFCDVAIIDNPDLNWQDIEEYLYYDNCAHNHESIDKFLLPVTLNLKRINKLNNILL